MKIGYIVGRFQSLTLHDGYKFLIDRILEDCDRFGIVLSKSPLPETIRNPFTIEERMAILTQNLDEFGVWNKFNGFIVIKDNPSDKNWSTDLDRALSREAAKASASGSPVQVALYGSRDSFIPHYAGYHEINTIKSPFPTISSTFERERLLETITPSYYFTPEYISGKLKALSAQYPKVYPTVDVAIFNEHGQVLLGRKPYEDNWRFPGGFVDPTDASFEAAARREASEECGDIEIGDVSYIASVKIDDWRYRSENDKIITTFFAAKYVYGKVQAGDDLADVDWFGIDELKATYESRMMGAHKSLFLKLVEYLEKKNK